MILAIAIAGILHAGTAVVQVSASRQVSVGEMKVMKRMKLSVYRIAVCADESVDLAADRAFAALAVRGVPVEDPAFLPLIVERGREESLLGRLRSFGEIGGGGTAIVAGLLQASPWIAPAGAGLALMARLAKGKQDAIVSAIMPLAARLLRPGETLMPARGACHSGFALSSGDVPYAETTVLVQTPDAPIRLNTPNSLSQWKPLPVDVEWTSE